MRRIAARRVRPDVASAFAEFDTDGDGTITASELTEVFRHFLPLSPEVSDADMASLVETLGGSTSETSSAYAGIPIARFVEFALGALRQAHEAVEPSASGGADRNAQLPPTPR